MINANLSVPKNWEILVQNLVTKACTKCKGNYLNCSKTSTTFWNFSKKSPKIVPCTDFCLSWRLNSHQFSTLYYFYSALRTLTPPKVVPYTNLKATQKRYHPTGYGLVHWVCTPLPDSSQNIITFAGYIMAKIGRYTLCTSIHLCSTHLFSFYVEWQAIQIKNQMSIL